MTCKSQLNIGKFIYFADKIREWIKIQNNNILFKNMMLYAIVLELLTQICIVCKYVTLDIEMFVFLIHIYVLFLLLCKCCISLYSLVGYKYCKMFNAE